MIRVIKTGFYSTIQDLGRHGCQQYGVPYSGVMDVYSGILANALVGNNEGAALMEITMTGPTLQFNIDTIIGLSGADVSAKINNTPVKTNRSLVIKKGDVLSFGKLQYGFRGYLSILGGFNTEFVMHSYSMYKNITKQSMIHKNDELQIGSASISSKANASIKINTTHFTSKNIDVFKGPEFHLLSAEHQKRLLSETFTISKNNNRMAYQLNESLENSLTPIITSAVLPGTVQLTPSGKLIILMKDCQTTGGYPRVLQLKEASINVLSQKFTNQSIAFKLVES